MFYRENGQYKSSYQADQQIFPVTQDRVVILVLVVLAFAAVPMLASDYLLRAIIIPFLIMSMAAIGINILVGYCGQISLGSGAFMAVGAYGTYNVMVHFPGIPLLLALILGGLCATFFGILFGLPSLRVKGLYLAVTTLAAQFFSDWIFLRVAWLTNYSTTGGVSVSGLEVFGLPLSSTWAKYWFALTMVCLIALLSKNLVRGALGREWMAIRDMDVAAVVIGIRPTYAKLSAFAVSSFIIGVSGALWGFIHLSAWEPAAFSVDMSIRLLFMVIIGGMGSIMGGFFGAAFVIVLPIALTQLMPLLLDPFGIRMSTAGLAHTELMVFGGLTVWFLIVEPHGLARLWSIGRQKLRIWPFPH